MKTTGFLKGCWPWTLILCLYSPVASLAVESQPQITAIRQESTNVVVEVTVPAGTRRLTLECRDRLGNGAWEPRAVARLNGSGGRVTFRLALSRHLELMRVRGDATEPLPAAFYSGTNTFVGEPGNAPDAPVIVVDGWRGVGPNAPGTAGPPEPSRDVVESDIWKIRGSTLYFFNQYRGLQVIDISNPNNPVLEGTYTLPAAGEQMYLLGSDHVVLLARNSCYYDASGNESQVLILKDDGGEPSVAAKLSVNGHIMESRLVGQALYVASFGYHITTNGTSTTWESRTIVSAFDLSTPNAPVVRGTLFYPGYGMEVAATERYFFVISYSNWLQSVVHLVDISDPNGTMRALSSVQPAGRVADKFKIHVNDDVLTIISQVQTTNLMTKLETFSLDDPTRPRKVGELTLGLSERLHATRFDRDRVYVVTFFVRFQMDPLWVVDLSDPARPTIKGELEIPGWSTFLQPLGDKLVALGIETNRTTVSLFNVADPSKPALLSRVFLGEGWSWSEGNWDEKAFNVLADDGLILVPFQSWTTNGYVQQVQMIDLATNSLKLRGVIDHQFQPRRATLVRNRILSISAQELLSVDASDRDHPEVRAKLQLAWPVDRVFVHGAHLLELSTGSHSWGWWYNPGETDPVIRVASTDEPDHVLASFRFTNKLSVIGATKQGNHLYVAQAPISYYYYPWIDYAADSGDRATNNTPFVLTVFALDDLPQLRVAGRVETSTKSPFWGSDLQALWPRPGVLVWSGGGFDWWWRIMPLAAGAPVDSRGFAPWPWFWPNTGGQLLAFDVDNPAAPALASEVSLLGTNHYSFSRAFAAEGLVYLSHQSSEFVPGLETPWTRPPYTNITHDTATGHIYTNVWPRGSWVTKYYLDVVDYADAKDPTVRKPVNISGSLQGISHRGAMVYTHASEYTRTTNNGYTWTQKLDALAYDGVSAHLVDSLPLPNAWPQPVRVVGNNIFLGRSGYDYSSTNRFPHYLETWAVPDTGKFTRLGRLELASPAQTLQEFPGMLVTQTSENEILLMDLADPANLKVIGRGRPSGCMWFDLTHGDGSSSRGLWLPLGGFGVSHIPVE